MEGLSFAMGVVLFFGAVVGMSRLLDLGGWRQVVGHGPAGRGRRET